MLERLRIAVNNYLMREFEEDCYKSIEDLPEIIPLAYTTTEDEEHEVQCVYNRVLCELWDMFDNEVVTRYYINHDCFIDMMGYVTFDELVCDLLADTWEDD